VAVTGIWIASLGSRRPGIEDKEKCNYGGPAGLLCTEVNVALLLVRNDLAVCLFARGVDGLLEATAAMVRSQKLEL
jgi:hypothetical protein